MIYKIVGGNLSPITVEKRWGSETTLGVSNRVALKKISLQPNEALSRQVHIFKDEIYWVLSGHGHLEVGPQGEIVHLLSGGDAVYLMIGRCLKSLRHLSIRLGEL